MPKPPTNADQATTRLEGAIARNTGWQLQYDMSLLIEDRKRLLARITELAGNLSAIRGWTNSNLAILHERQHESATSETTAKIFILDALSRVLNQLDTAPTGE